MNTPNPWDEPIDPELVVDAEVVEEEVEAEVIEPDALAVILANDTRDVAVSYRDPDSVALFAQDLRRQIRANVTALMHSAAEERIDAGKPSTAAYAAEWQLAADVIESLTEVADAIKSGTEVAEAHAAMLLEDVTDPTKRTRSVRVGDGHGRDLKVGLTQGTAVSVDRDTVLDLIVGEIMAQPFTDAIEAEEPVRAALDKLLSLVSGPAWKITALDAWKRTLEDSGRHAEAITLGHAYGRADKGEPRFKIERVDPAKRATR